MTALQALLLYRGNIFSQFSGAVLATDYALRQVASLLFKIREADNQQSSWCPETAAAYANCCCLPVSPPLPPYVCSCLFIHTFLL